MISSTANMARDQVFDKMKDLTFHSVVNKVLLGALPIDSSEMTRENTLAVSRYTRMALESAGGFELLEKALENTKDPIKHNFLEKIYAICTESSMEVANRVALEDLNFENAEVDTSSSRPDDSGSSGAMDTNDPEDSGAAPQLDDSSMKEDADTDDTTIDDVKAPDDTEEAPIKPEVIRQGIPYQKLVADAKMTDKEYQRYVERLGKLDTPEISKMINERVETAMKAEKETYRMIDESDKRLRDAITDKADDEGETLTDDQAEEIKESMLYVPLKHSQREHVSLISTLQKAAIESIQLNNVSNFMRVDPDILLSITENYSVDGIFGKTEPTLEQTLDDAFNAVKFQAANECVCPEKAIVLGTAFATIVYTFLQTLHSMNLVKITPQMVQHCCHKHSPFEIGASRPMDDFNPRVRAALERHDRKISKMNYAPDVEAALDELNHIRSRVYVARDNGFPVEKTTVDAIEQTIARALDKKKYLEDAEASASEATTLAYGGSPRYFETDVCNMNSVARTFRNTPVDSIEFRCTEGAEIINVLGIKNGNNVKSTTLALETALDANITTGAYLKALVLHSNLPDLKYGESQPTITTYIDGNRKRIR